MEAQLLVLFPLLLLVRKTMAEIAGSHKFNKIIPKSPEATPVPPIEKNIPVSILNKIKPVGAPIAKNFIPLTEIPPPHLPLIHSHNGRRHMDPDCGSSTPREIYDGARVEIWGDYYEEKFAKTVATVLFPDHIDRKHFEVTEQVPYLTVGPPIDGIGYHPSTIKSEHPSECEKIYQDHVAEQYSEESKDLSEESLEMARMPLFPPIGSVKQIDTEAEADMYEDGEDIPTVKRRDFSVEVAFKSKSRHLDWPPMGFPWSAAVPTSTVTAVTTEKPVPPIHPLIQSLSTARTTELTTVVSEESGCQSDK